MITVKIGDGMGNQLFNYACGYAAARREGERLRLDTSECDNAEFREFMLDRFNLKYDERESFPNRTFLQKAYKRLRRNAKYRVIRERAFFQNRRGRYSVDDVDPRVFERGRLRGKYLHGYWQNLSYFIEYMDEITAMMTPAYPQSERVIALRERLAREASCAVHVRGGDITGPGAEYFSRAIAMMEGAAPGNGGGEKISYYVFTNDRERATEALSKVAGDAADRMRYVADMGDFSDVDEFFLMAACQNQILSNSTFSTWAAYCNPNKGKTVIMPYDTLSARMKLPGWVII